MRGPSLCYNKNIPQLRAAGHEHEGKGCTVYCRYGTPNCARCANLRFLGLPLCPRRFYCMEMYDYSQVFTQEENEARWLKTLYALRVCFKTIKVTKQG